MERKIGKATIMIAMILMMALMVTLPTVKAQETIYIRADGSIDPSDAPISTVDNITYTLTGNITADANAIVIERDNIVVDGAGYTVQGTNVYGSKGTDVTGRNNVTIKNTNIQNYCYGIYLDSFSSYNIISGNNITATIDGIHLDSSSNNSISGNNITNNECGIVLSFSSGSSISGNNITNNEGGIALSSSSGSSISGNNITNNWYGIVLSSSSSSSISGNNITANTYYGIMLFFSSNNSIFHNNLINNAQQVYSSGSMNVWDNGCPSGGNYWSDYNGTDLYNGPEQNMTGSDGIGDTPYVIDANNTDNYPLIKPYVPFENQTIYIRADGSIDPTGAPIQRKGDLYALTDNVTSGDVDGIVVERDNVVVDGNGYGVHGNVVGTDGLAGLSLTGMSNVTIKNFSYIGGFNLGIYLYSSNNNLISGNFITAVIHGVGLFYSNDNIVSGNDVKAAVGYGIVLQGSSNNNTVIDNNATANGNGGIAIFYSSSSTFIEDNTVMANNGFGICVLLSDNTSVSGNNITANSYDEIQLLSSSNCSISGNNVANAGAYYEGIYLWNCSDNSVSGNNITANSQRGIFIRDSNYNSISGNNITNNGEGIDVWSSSGNSIFHNNFINNTNQVYSSDSVNVWDDGYPSGGNYWNDYTDPDSFFGAYQNLTGSDGIDDMPYAIDGNNRDNYPLMKPYPWAADDIGVTSVTTSKNVVGQGYNASISVMMFNYGNDTEVFNVTVYANQTLIGEIFNVTLTSGNSTTVTFTWNTTGFAKGNYTISAVADIVPDETDTGDNLFTDGIVYVGIPGDINADGIVELMDFYYASNAYLSQPGKSNWNPNADINDDSIVEMMDFFIMSQHYLEHEP
jgi:parallel beta-helix repeat protein